ncbi:MAG TPA: hypothetical protein VGB82_09695 [Alphaproteobacteria bacterium]
MMRQRTIAWLGLIIALGGCQNLEWSHPQFGTSRLQADLTDCDHIAVQESSRYAGAEPLLTAPHVSRLPSGQVVSDPTPRFPSGSSYPNPGEMRSFCMRSKGYELVPVPEAK